MTTDLDVMVLGAGLRGLRAGLDAHREHGCDRVMVLDAEPRAGGCVHTLRSNGFVCELGPFAFPRNEIDPLLAALERPPTPVAGRDAARTGFEFGAAGRREIAVDPAPWSFGSGNEELVQACRRELGTALRLGRRATSVDVADGTLAVTLGGEVAARMTTQRLVVALPDGEAAALLARFDPALAGLARRVARAPGAFAFYGALSADAPELRGYGALPAADCDSPIAELVFCTEVFPDRALRDRCLVRAELAGPLLERDDDAVLAAAERELRRWTGTRAHFGFTKLHRFCTEIADGTVSECRTRNQELARRVPGLVLAP